jgi:hypothetical protein
MSAEEARSPGPNLSKFLEWLRCRFEWDKTFDHWQA